MSAPHELTILKVEDRKSRNCKYCTKKCDSRSDSSLQKVSVWTQTDNACPSSRKTQTQVKYTVRVIGSKPGGNTFLQERIDECSNAFDKVQLGNCGATTVNVSRGEYRTYAFSR